MKTDLFKELSGEIDSYFKLQEEKFEEKLKKIEDDFKIKINSIDGSIYHIQGNNFLENNNYGLALNSFLTAASCYILGEDELNLQRVNKIIIDKCLPEIYKNDCEEIPQLEIKKKALIELFEMNNQKGRYYDDIQNISLGFEKAKNRTRRKNISDK